MELQPYDGSLMKQKKKISTLLFQITIGKLLAGLLLNRYEETEIEPFILKEMTKTKEKHIKSEQKPNEQKKKSSRPLHVRDTNTCSEVQWQYHSSGLTHH